MTSTDSWQFNYSTEEILKAANIKAQHHAQRVSWWRSEWGKAKERVRKDVTVEDFIGISGDVANGRDRQYVHIDRELQRQVQECWDKVQQHERNLAYLNTILSAVGHSPARDYVLDLEGIAYLGL